MACTVGLSLSGLRERRKRRLSLRQEHAWARAPGSWPHSPPRAELRPENSYRGRGARGFAGGAFAASCRPSSQRALPLAPQVAGGRLSEHMKDPGSVTRA